MRSNTDTAFTIDTSSIKYGPGVTMEIGYEMSRLGSKNCLVVTDPNMKQSEAMTVTQSSLSKENIKVTVFDEVQVEPTDQSFKTAIQFAIDGQYDGFVAVGGGSSMDTAKAANLYSTYPDEFLAYVNAPIGKGKQVPGPLKPLVAIPTTGGTGSETTGVSIFDFIEMFNKGTVLISKEINVYDIYDRDDIDEIVEELGVEKIRKIKSEDFEPDFIKFLL